MTVPIVDFGRFLNGSLQEREEAAAAVDAAFQNVGFVYLHNHGVPQERVDECFDWSEKFFNLPEETKLLAPHPPGGSHHRGYSGLGVEKVSQHVFDDDTLAALRNVADVKESFESGNVADAAQPNIWLPEHQLPGFRASLESFFVDCCRLVHDVLRALALALRLPRETFLSDTHAAELFQLRLLHYPPVPVSVLRDGSKARIEAHSDFGTLTLLFQDAVGGLQIEDPHRPGVFQNVPPRPGSVLVNVGDLMERWSNGRWRSTVHRVVAPPAAVEGEGRELEGGGSICAARRSIPFFATADPETVIEALPGCWGEENPKKFESVTAWEYVQMRMAALYA